MKLRKYFIAMTFSGFILLLSWKSVIPLAQAGFAVSGTVLLILGISLTTASLIND